MPIEVKINGKPKADINDLFKDVEKFSESLNSDIIDAVTLACLQVVTEARNLPSPPETAKWRIVPGKKEGTSKKVYNPHQPYYIDDSSILRHSIGFAIYDKGVKVMQNFEQQPGAELGVAVADEAAQKFPNQIVAIIVAGANYAAAVESKGYFVLTQPTMKLPEILQGYLRQIAERL